MSFGGSAFSNLTFGGHGVIVYALGASAITTAAPSVPAAALGRIINTASEEIATGSPTNGTPVIAQDEKLNAPELVTPSPVLDAANSGENERFFANELSATHVLGTSPIVQKHVIAIGNLNNVAVSVPAITMQEAEEFGASSITTAAPTVPTTALVRNIVLSTADITTAAPVNSTTVIAQNEALNAVAITTAAVSLGSCPISQTHAIGGRTFTTDTSVVSSAPFNQGQTLNAVGITTGPISYPSSNTMIETEALVSPNINTGTPSTPTTVIEQKHILAGETVITENPMNGTPPEPFPARTNIAQSHIFVGADFNNHPAFVVSQAPFTENNILSTSSVNTGASSVPNTSMFEDEEFTTANITTGAPSFPATPISQNHIIANQADLNTGTSSTPASVFNQGQTLSAQSITTASPVNDDAVFAYNYVLSSANVNCAPASVPAITMQENESFAGASITTGQPSVPSVQASVDYNLSSPTISLGNPTLATTSITVNHVLNGLSITTGSPSVPIQLYNAALGRIADFESNAVGQAVLTIQSPNEVILSDKSNKVVLAA